MDALFFKYDFLRIFIFCLNQNFELLSEIEQSNWAVELRGLWNWGLFWTEEFSVLKKCGPCSEMRVSVENWGCRYGTESVELLAMGWNFVGWSHSISLRTLLWRQNSNSWNNVMNLMNYLSVNNLIKISYWGLSWGPIVLNRPEYPIGLVSVQ